MHPFRSVTTLVSCGTGVVLFRHGFDFTRHGLGFIETQLPNVLLCKRTSPLFFVAITAGSITFTDASQRFISSIQSAISTKNSNCQKIKFTQITLLLGRLILILIQHPCHKKDTKTHEKAHKKFDAQAFILPPHSRVSRHFSVILQTFVYF